MSELYWRSPGEDWKYCPQCGCDLKEFLNCNSSINFKDLNLNCKQCGTKLVVEQYYKLEKQTE